MPFEGGERKGRQRFGHVAHGGGCPVEQVGEHVVDGSAPEESPPEDAAPDEQIDETEQEQIADDSEQGNAPEVVCDERSGED